MSLTTPVPRDEDVTFPGEGWFYYWKTSASLWRSKLETHLSGPLVIVPLNWSFHSETGDTYDFAQHRPETDLQKLCLIAEELHKKVVFLLPLSPAPFLPNGGLPHFLARTMALNEEGLAQMAVDADGSFNKLYSFFDSRVYQAFTRFTHELSQYFSRSGINADVIGMRSFSYCPYLGLRSLMTDRSIVFEQSFARYLKARTEEEGLELTNGEQEADLKLDYTVTIERLYEENAKRAFHAHWEGTLNYAFLGTSGEDQFGRLAHRHRDTRYAVDLLECLALDHVPSSALLPSRAKRSVLKRQSQDLVLNSFLLSKLERYEDEESSLFKPLIHFELAELDPKSKPRDHHWTSNGLLPYLRATYPFSYLIHRLDQRSLEEEEGFQERVLFYLGHGLNQGSFHRMLTRFMSGGRLIVDTSYMPEEFSKRLEVFMIENSLQSEKVNFHTSIQNIVLGEGRMVLIDGQKLNQLEESKLLAFWQRLLETFGLKILSLEGPEGVLHYWRTRAAHGGELNFEEVRRLSLYNPSSYKRKLTIQLPKTMALMKVIDSFHVEVQPRPSHIEVQMLPEGSVSLDFGLFS